MTVQNSFLSPLKWTLFQRKMHCCDGRRNGVTCAKVLIHMGHNIIYDITLSTKSIHKTIKNATETNVVSLVHSNAAHFVYVLIGFPFVREGFSKT